MVPIRRGIGPSCHPPASSALTWSALHPSALTFPHQPGHVVLGRAEEAAISKQLAIRLVQHERTRTVGPVDAERFEHWPPPASKPEDDQALADAITKAARSAGATTEHKTGGRTSTGAEANYGGMSSVIDAFQIVEFGWNMVEGMATVGGCATFLGGSMAKLKSWKAGRPGRTIEIDYKGQKLKIEDGQSVEDVVRQIETLAASKQA